MQFRHYLIDKGGLLDYLGEQANVSSVTGFLAGAAGVGTIYSIAEGNYRAAIWRGAATLACVALNRICRAGGLAKIDTYLDQGKDPM